MVRAGERLRWMDASTKRTAYWQFLLSRWQSFAEKWKVWSFNSRWERLTHKRNTQHFIPYKARCSCLHDDNALRQIVASITILGAIKNMLYPCRENGFFYSVLHLIITGSDEIHTRWMSMCHIWWKGKLSWSFITQIGKQMDWISLLKVIKNKRKTAKVSGEVCSLALATYDKL